MNCSKCGYLMDAFDQNCPKCQGQGLAPKPPAPPVPTSRQSLTSAARTAASITSAVLSAGASKKPPKKKLSSQQAFQVAFEASSTAGLAQRGEATVRKRREEAQAALNIYERLLAQKGEDDPLTQEALRRADGAAQAVTTAQIDHLMAVEKAARAKQTLDES